VGIVRAVNDRIHGEAVMDIACVTDLLFLLALCVFSVSAIASREFPFFGSKRLPPRPTVALGVAGLVGLAVVVAAAVVEGLLLILSNGIGPEARRHPDEAAQIFYVFLIFKLSVVFVLVVLYFVIGYLCAKPRSTEYIDEIEYDDQPFDDPDWR
jgi:hypothetical protein